MTKEELRKEAEEWLSITDNHLNDERTHFLSESEYAEQAYLAGAEFGYNKANEWHYVKDGDLPKEQQLVILYRENSNGANVALAYWYKSYVNDKVIAWKEIVLPELKESK